MFGSFSLFFFFFFFFLSFVGNLKSVWGSQWTYPYLHYMQCNPAWGYDVMGVNGDGERSTICMEGCAMTSVSMALTGLIFEINGSLANPGNLNVWLEENNGYLCMDGDCNDLNIPIIDNLTNQILQYDASSSNSSMNELRRGLDAQDTIYIAHIPSLSHFVFCLNASWTGEDSEYIQVYDPFYNTTAYNYAQVGSFIVYGIYNTNRSYTYYAQCDKAWANDVMGEDGDTICQVGCLMTSVSMALNSWNIPIPLNNDSTITVEANPATLNQWLQMNNGYAEGTSDLEESALNNLNAQGRVVWPSDGMHTTNDIPVKTIASYVNDRPRRVVIANVMNGDHFVLVTNVWADQDTLSVNDPGQFHTTYSYSKDVVGWRLFDLY